MTNFNSEMFSAILASNEKTLALVEKQLADAKEQAKRNDKKFYVTVSVLSVLLGVMIWAYSNKKAELQIGYDQENNEVTVSDSSSVKNAEINN